MGALRKGTRFCLSTLNATFFVENDGIGECEFVDAGGRSMTTLC